MKTTNKLLVAVAAFGAAAVPNFTASAADISASATFTLATTPAPVTVSTATPVAFGQRYIPVADNVDYTIDPAASGGGQGSVTIDNGRDAVSYSLTLGAATCPANVTFAPTAAYNGTTVASGTNFTYATAATTVSLGGTLNVTSDATAGSGSCTFQVTVADT